MWEKYGPLVGYISLVIGLPFSFWLLYKSGKEK
jgi:hypothetical protein